MKATRIETTRQEFHEMFTLSWSMTKFNITSLFDQRATLLEALPSKPIPAKQLRAIKLMQRPIEASTSDFATLQSFLRLQVGAYRLLTSRSLSSA